MDFPNTASLIMPRLWLGDLLDATAFQAKNFEKVLCVLETRPSIEPSHADHIPIFNGVTALPSQLDKAADYIASNRDKNLLVHCGAGIERSPLTLAWYLWRKRNYSWSEAYALLKEKRPEVQDRTIWLPSEWISRVSLISASAP